MRTWIALLLEVLTDTAGNMFLSRGMKQVGRVGRMRSRNWRKLIYRALSNPMLAIGFFSMTFNFLLFIALLSWADLSFVIPGTAVSYVTGIIGAKFFLKEQVTKERLMGSIVICIGVVLLSINSGVK
jgi:drug/metabolite transporter (DMT)-like permease